MVLAAFEVMEFASVTGLHVGMVLSDFHGEECEKEAVEFPVRTRFPGYQAEGFGLFLASLSG